MTPAPARDVPLFVEAPARLHFGVLDLRGDLGRRFGGIGAAVPAPSLLLEASAADTLTADGPDAERALEFARRFTTHHGLRRGARLRLHRVIPPHAGLGSGTQLALAVARSLAELHGLPTDAPALARAVGRARRSAIGTWIFQAGGFVLEGGRRPGQDGAAPLLARLPMPTNWRCVLAIPTGGAGLSGEAEEAAFDRLPLPAAAEVNQVAHLVLLQLLPSLVEADLPGFGAALSEIQRVTGGWFAPAQGGAFARGDGQALIRQMELWGAAGVGQSSWGPAVYGLIEEESAGRRLADRVRGFLGNGGEVHVGGFDHAGALFSRGSPPVRTD